MIMKNITQSKKIIQFNMGKNAISVTDEYTYQFTTKFDNTSRQL